jgi:hypothetical protein
MQDFTYITMAILHFTHLFKVFVSSFFCKILFKCRFFKKITFSCMMQNQKPCVLQIYISFETEGPHFPAESLSIIASSKSSA